MHDFKDNGAYSKFHTGKLKFCTSCGLNIKSVGVFGHAGDICKDYMHTVLKNHWTRVLSS